MTVEELHNRVLFMLQKDQGGFFNPGEIDEAFNKVQLEYLRELLQARPNQIGQPKGLGADAQTNRALQPFATSTSLVTGVTGIYTFLEDVAHFRNLESRDEEVSAAELPDRLNSAIIAPTEARPIFVQQNKGLKFYPAAQYTKQFHYIRFPLNVFFNYSIAGRQVVFNPTGSVNPQWGDIEMEVLVRKTAEYISSNNQDYEVRNFEVQKTAGA